VKNCLSGVLYEICGVGDVAAGSGAAAAAAGGCCGGGGGGGGGAAAGGGGGGVDGEVDAAGGGSGWPRPPSGQARKRTTSGRVVKSKEKGLLEKELRFARLEGKSGLRQQ
jgi:hypothetical protein